MLERVGDGAVRRQQLARALRADAREPRELVFITHQREPLADLLRQHVEALADNLFGVADVLVRVEPPRALGHQLREALVDADEQDVVTLTRRRARVAGGGGELVIDLDDGEAERATERGER